MALVRARVGAKDNGAIQNGVVKVERGREQAGKGMTLWNALLTDIGSANPRHVGQGSLELERKGNWLRRLTGIGDRAVLRGVEVFAAARRQGVASTLAYCAMHGMRDRAKVEFTPNADNEAASAWALAAGMTAVSSVPGVTDTYVGRVGDMREGLLKNNPRIATAEMHGPVTAFLEASIEADLDSIVAQDGMASAVRLATMPLDQVVVKGD